MMKKHDEAEPYQPGLFWESLWLEEVEETEKPADIVDEPQNAESGDQPPATDRDLWAG